MKIVNILLLSAASIAFAACTTTGEEAAPAVSADAVSAVLSEAKAEYAKAEEAGFAWRDTEKMMKEAEEAMKAGDLAKANKLAKKALNQSKNAQAQAAAQSNAGPNL